MNSAIASSSFRCTSSIEKKVDYEIRGIYVKVGQFSKICLHTKGAIESSGTTGPHTILSDTILRFNYH